MKWKKISTNYNDVINFITKGLKTGDDYMEKLRCAYTTDDNIINIVNIFELVDLSLPIDKVKSFALYQVIE